MVLAIVHGMENCQNHRHLYIPWTIVHAMDYWPMASGHGMHNCPWYGQLSMTWTIAIQLFILLKISIVKTIVHSTDRL